MTVKISFDSLWTHGPGPQDERASLAHLSVENTHVHGLLRIDVGGRDLPALGYFGPDDVCFNAWVRELAIASRTLTASDPSAYVYDEGEQGQPAFHFERSGAELLISVRASEISDGAGDSTWERVACALDDFVTEVARFLLEFRYALEAQAGTERAHVWWGEIADST